MGWIRVSDDFYDNDKLSDVGPIGQAMFFVAMGFCNRNLTDGYFKKGKARGFLDLEGVGITTVKSELFSGGVDGDDAARLVISWMVAADLWHEQGHDCDECHAREDGGEPASNEYLVHDYLKFQYSKAQIEEKAEANRRRVEAWRESRKGNKPGTNGSRNAGSNDVGNALHTDSVTGHVQPTPNPTPTPTVLSDERTSLGGCVSGDTHLGADLEPPRCPRHHNNGNPNDDPCRKCRAVKDWVAAQEAAKAADELEQQRQKRIVESRLLKACKDCDEDGWRYDDREIRCRHQEAM